MPALFLRLNCTEARGSPEKPGESLNNTMSQ